MAEVVWAEPALNDPRRGSKTRVLNSWRYRQIISRRVASSTAKMPAES